MAIKWKNFSRKNKETEDIEIYETDTNEESSILDLRLGIIAGIAFVFALLFFIQSMLALKTSEDINGWRLAMGGYVFLAYSMKVFFMHFFQKKYAKLETDREDIFYTIKKIEKMYIKIALLIVAVFTITGSFFMRLMEEYDYWNDKYVYNTDIMNIFIYEGIVISIVLLYEFSRVSQKKKREAVEFIRSISKVKLQEALEKEKESLMIAAKSEKLKMDLITNVSHDLKTPLTSMVGYIELLRKEELGNVASDYVEVIHDKAVKLNEMIESLFTMAKASSGNLDFHIEKVNLNTLVEQILADMEDMIMKSGLNIRTILTDRSADIETDNIYIYRVCQNIIENALKYSAERTRVFIKTEVIKNELSEYVSVKVTNTAGYEMDFEKEDILERFARGDKTRSSEGSGLGLAIVSTFTNALGGIFDISINYDQFVAEVRFPRNFQGER